MYGGGGSDAADLMRADEKARQARIQRGTEQVNDVFSQFTPDFYANRAKQYERYALPSLAQEYDQARRQLVYRLGSQGLLNSFAGAGAASSLRGAVQQGQRTIADKGVSEAQLLRRETEGNKQQVLNQLFSSASPSLAKQGALESASQTTAPSSFAPVGNLLSNWGDIYTSRSMANLYGPLAQQLAEQQRTQNLYHTTLRGR